MSIKLFTLALLTCALLASSPVVLVSQEDHHPLFTSQDLLEYLGRQSEAQLVELTSPMSDDYNQIKSILREAGVSKERISSFLTSAQKMYHLKDKLLQQPSITQLNVTVQELKSILKEGRQDVVITMHPMITPRRLQMSNYTNGTSLIFESMTPAALSGLWVTLFLIVMLLIGINCMLNLKTNDRFARQNLWVGRES